MRMVNINELQNEEILAREIRDIDGRMLLAKGIRLKPSYLNKLNEIGLSNVYIEDGISEGIEEEVTLCHETKSRAMLVVKNEMSRFVRTREVNYEEIDRMVSTILEDVLANKTGLINLKDMWLKDEYLFSHSVNVCTLSVLLARRLGTETDKLKHIGIGGMLHDFGKMLVPDEIVKKPGKLTGEEYEDMKMHTIYGYEVFKKDFTVSAITKVIILRHHERVDGSGYPDGIKGDSIHDSAKICGICDVFDATTSDRVYRKAMNISDVLALFQKSSGTHFKKEFVNEFLKMIPIYQTGSIVQLNTGVIGIVVKNNESNLARPVIRLLYNPRNKIKYNKLEFDMREENTLKIDRVLNSDSKEYHELLRSV